MNADSIETLIFFLVVIGVSYVMPQIAKKFKVPYVTSIVLAGIIFGPFGLELIPLNETAEFIAVIGAIFVMFMAGLDIKLSTFKKLGWKVIIVALANGLIPPLCAYLFCTILGYDLMTSLIMAVIFMSSSVGVIIPSLSEAKLHESKMAETVIGATVIEDVASLFLFAFVMKISNTTHSTFELSMPIYLLVVIVSLLLIAWLIPLFEKWFIKSEQKDKVTQKEDVFEHEFMFIFLILIAISIFFEVIGMHSIVAGFIVGMVLSDQISRRLVNSKIRTIAYSFFIPIFFLVVGLKTDLTVIFTAADNILITLGIVVLLFISKLFSGFLGGVVSGFSINESLAIGSSTIPQLSTSLVVAIVAKEYGFFDDVLINAVVVMSICTTLFAPMLMNYFYGTLGHLKKKD